MFYNFKKNKKAFTLVELIVVIAIIAILGTVVGISVTRFVASAKEKSALTAAQAVSTCWETFIAESASGTWGSFMQDNLSNYSTMTIAYVGTGISANTTSSQALSATGKINVTTQGKTARVEISGGKVTKVANGAAS